MLADGRARTDRLLGNLLLAHFPVALMLAPMRGTWLSAFLIGLSVSLASFFLARTRPAEAVTRLVIAAALMVYSALFIHQSGGMVELHFHIFSSLAFLLAYRDWRPIVLAAAVIAVHHLLFMVLQASGAGVHAFPDGHGSLGIVVVHALFVVMETSVLVWLSRRLEDEALEVEQLHIVARALAAGNVDVDVKGGATADAYRRVIATVRLLVSEASGVADAMKRNDFTRRGDASKFDGSFRGVIEDLNASVDSLQQSRGAMERQRDDVLRFLSGLRRAVDGLARREMTVRLEGSFEGDQHAAQHAFNDAIAHLESTLADASALSANCREASQEIAEGSATLARGANEQASSVEEASASLQQLSSMSISTAQHAAAGRRLAEETRASAASGVEAMQALNEAVARIKSSADQTAKIVRTIDEIAFQTNLLALNAAVEAARAGDAGRGFAVVAVEVRELAMRSAEAARSSTDMIAESVKTAARGTELSEKVAARLAEIDSQVGKVRDVINDIASSNEQQATGVSQIATAMEHVGRITQEASANAEHSQSIAGTLATESERMAALLSEFDVRGGAIGDGTKRQPLGTGRTKEPQRKVSVGRPRIHAG